MRVELDERRLPEKGRASAGGEEARAPVAQDGPRRVGVRARGLDVSGLSVDGRELEQMAEEDGRELRGLCEPAVPERAQRAVGHLLGAGERGAVARAQENAC